MAPPATSAITMAFASPSPSAGTKSPVNIMSIATFAAAAKHGPGMPLTPPNSVSPNLPAQVTRLGLASPPPIQIDGDVDLQDAVDHAAAQDQPVVPLSKGALSGLDASEAITASMLAKHHLPGIILGHGPVAIRHVMGCLTQAVPGFSRIPPAKARRLVVAALEGRAGGGLSGEVVFEKVGWGRWDAHMKCEGLAFGHKESDGKFSPPESEPGSYAASYSEAGLSIPTARNNRGKQDLQSWAGSWIPQSYDEHLDDMCMAENEADKMSLDGSATPESEDDSMTSDSSTGDETEEEDWTAIGPDALRKASLSTVASTGIRRNYNLISIPGTLYEARRASEYSVGVSRTPQARSASHFAQRPSYAPQSGGAQGTVDAMETHQTSQEREAIEALLRMGSM